MNHLCLKLYKMRCEQLNFIDGTPCAMKVARTVWSRGKDGDDFKVLPIAIFGYD